MYRVAAKVRLRLCPLRYYQVQQMATTKGEDNATRYASEYSKIELALKKRSRGGVTLQVSNAVDAMPEGDLKRLFDRFYRADISRNSQTGGSGVGLSVAQAIVEAHGGSIRAQALDARTICFTVTLP